MMPNNPTSKPDLTVHAQRLREMANSKAESALTRREMAECCDLEEDKCRHIRIAEKYEANAAALLAGAEALESKSCECWLIYFHDQDIRPEIFTDEEAARKRFDVLNQSWTVNLFAALARLEGK